MLSDQYELACLRVLRDHRPGGYVASVVVAQEADLPTWTARSALKSLARRHLAARSFQPATCGYYSITPRGLEELAAAEQLRMVV
jgi:DNA-binding IclR family transcriptional regulator